MGFQYKVVIGLKNENSVLNEFSHVLIKDIFKKRNIPCDYEDENSIVFVNYDSNKDMYAYFALALDEVYENKELLKNVLFARAYESLTSDAFVDVFEEYKEFELEYGKD